MDLLLFIVIFCLLQGSVSASCGYPGSPAHSRVLFSDNQLVEGSFATYECERGFELLGPVTRYCEADGKWTPDGVPFCVINVAAGKAAMQVSTEEGGASQKALDGSTAPAYNSETCTLTKVERTPWWYVNLLEPYMVQLVRLDFGSSCCEGNKPAVIVVRVGNSRPDLGTNQICNRFTGFIDEGLPLFLPCNPPMPGAFVSVHLESSSPSQLSICEAFVYTDQALPIESCPQFRDQPPGSTATYNGKCYIFYHHQPMTFRDSLAFCQSRGGTLVDESNPAPQGFISWELWRRHRSDSSSQYWMGAVRDAQDSANWKWVNGRDILISFWNGPLGGEICVRFDGSKGWLWTDTNCDAEMIYINIRAEQIPRVNVPSTVDGERRQPVGARLNIGAVVALAAFGALVFLIAIITTIVILVRSRKHNDGKRYLHQVSPDCNTVSSVDSSSSESRCGLNRHYRQAWKQLYEAGGAVSKHQGPWRHEREAPKDGSKLVVSDVYPAGKRDKRRHHHHREPRHPDWLPRAQHNHKY